jgi:hypothetical protein
VTVTAEAPARYVKLAPKNIVKVGALAGTDTPHKHAGDAWTGSSCMACFGWSDDPRHLARVPRARRARVVAA